MFANTDAVASEVLNEMAAMSGLILWRVQGTWANKGRHGTIDEVVEANNAIEAARVAWKVEDPRDLRTLSVEWLCPVESVVRDRSAVDIPNEKA